MQTVHSNIKDACIVTWNFTNRCNFACSYCPDDLHNGSSGFPDYNDALDFFSKLAKNHSMIYLELLGGETTLWPKLIEFLVALKQVGNFVVQLDTNGSRSVKWWERFAKAGLNSNVFLVFSYHAAWCDPEVYYKNLEIVSKDHAVVSNFMLDPEYFEKSNELYHRVVSALPVDCLFKVLRENFHPDKLIEGYTEDMLNIISNTAERFMYSRSKYPKTSDIMKWPTQILYNSERVNWQEFVINKKHSFKGWKCSAGNKRFYINFNGDAFSCAQLMHYQTELAGSNYLGNIKDRNIKILEKSIVCPVDYCPCKLDVFAEKYKE